MFLQPQRKLIYILLIYLMINKICFWGLSILFAFFKDLIYISYHAKLWLFKPYKWLKKEVKGCVITSLFKYNILYSDLSKFGLQTKALLSLCRLDRDSKKKRKTKRYQLCLDSKH